MPPCFCSSNPPSTSVSKFISDQPLLSMLETNCDSIKDLRKIHAQIIKTGLAKDTIAASRVLAFCATSSPASDLGYAYSVFSHIEKPNLFTWNTIIRGFCLSSNPRMAISLFIEMLLTSSVRPERLTYPSVFKAYTQLGLARAGAQLHGRIMKLGLDSDPFIRNSMLHMYANCGLLGDARKLFGESEDSYSLDVVAWNSMVTGLAKWGRVDEARSLFLEIPARNDVSWNTMISGFVKNGRWAEALSLFLQMQAEKIEPSVFALVSVLHACSKLGALEQGKWVHIYILQKDIELNETLLTAIIDMYCKCGEIEMARHVFKTGPQKGLSSWNSMILGLGVHGFENEAFELFSELESSESDIGPNPISFLGVLTVCSHSLQVDKARAYFKQMIERYEIEPSIEHYGCMVDVLGRSGLIEEAAELVRCLPMKPDAVIWGSLLSACKIHTKNVAIAEWAAENLNLTDADDTGAYITLSNMYAGSGDFKKAVQERSRMRGEMIGKKPGCSLMTVNGEVHEFVSGGKWHFMAGNN